MNEHVRTLPPRREPTQFAEGHPRWRWTLAEFEQLIEHGILDDDDKVELLGGEMVPMSPKGNEHEAMRQRLHRWLRRNLDPGIEYMVEPGWRLSADTYVEPDFLFHAADGGLGSVTAGSDALLVIEVSSSSLAKDLNIKAPLYAAAGVEDYWVIDARSGTTHVHRDPGPEGYASVIEVQDTEQVTALRIPDLSVALANLTL
ncbi:MAG: Uma2 family endonuclease [Planctomycetota bacterium]